MNCQIVQNKFFFGLIISQQFKLKIENLTWNKHLKESEHLGILGACLFAYHFSSGSNYWLINN